MRCLVRYFLSLSPPLWPGNRKAYRILCKNTGVLFSDTGRGQHPRGMAMIKDKEDLVGILEGLLFPVNDHAESTGNRAEVAGMGHLGCFTLPPHSSPA